MSILWRICFDSEILNFLAEEKAFLGFYFMQQHTECGKFLQNSYLQTWYIAIQHSTLELNFSGCIIFQRRVQEHMARDH